MSTVFNPADIQGNILRGYHKRHVRHLILEVTDAKAARGWLAASVSGRKDVPQITTEEPWETKPNNTFNIGLTFEGLRALGVAQASLDSFPTEFREGMTARAVKLGDVGDSAPDKWAAPFNEPKQVHLIATIHVDEKVELDRIEKQALAGSTGLKQVGVRKGHAFQGDYVHFGYADNISQPRFKEVPEKKATADPQPKAPLGTVLLGSEYETNFEGLKWRVPQPEALGHNGTFNAFRVLAQDVKAFETYLDQAATELLAHPKLDELLPRGAEIDIGTTFSKQTSVTRHGALRELVAAHMCGRWRDGTPLALSPEKPNSSVSRTNFDYDSASRCPYGAHTRRCNPRGGQIVQRVANFSRRLIRRGMPYGPAYEPNNDATKGKERGLLGNFIGASLGAQFEAMMCDWVNVGLQDPRVTGSNDPLIGANAPETSWFDLLLGSGETIRLRGFPRFVTTRGGAYTFLPSISAIRYLGSLAD